MLHERMPLVSMYLACASWRHPAPYWLQREEGGSSGRPRLSSVICCSMQVVLQALMTASEYFDCALFRHFLPVSGSVPLHSTMVPEDMKGRGGE
jgi:hypothetical protein